MLLVGLSAAPAAPVDEVWPRYWQAVRQACPARHLDLLAPAELRDVLDAFKAGPARPLRSKLDHAELKQCRGDAAGAGCANLADLALIEKHRLLTPLAAAVCQHFETCRDQSDCTATGR